MKRCDYSKTATGSCHQFALNGNECYYHSKVRDGLVEPIRDTELLRDLQTIKDN